MDYNNQKSLFAIDGNKNTENNDTVFVEKQNIDSANSLPNSIQERISSLRNTIEQHNYNYYVADSPTISDKEFDVLLKELEQLEKDNPQYYDVNSPTQRVGIGLISGFTSYPHTTPMLSLANTYTFAEVDEFYERAIRNLGVKQLNVVAELKFDGVSISLIYKNGELKQALTRGDGQIGDDVTHNIRTISSIPLKLHSSSTPFPDELIVRGEILMPFKQFDRLNNEREDSGDPLFANPRNATSGTLKLLNSSEVRRRKLDSFAYYAISNGFDNIKSHYERLNLLREWGFKVSNVATLCHSLDEVKAFITTWDTQRRTLPFATDGVVLKIDNIAYQQELGTTAKAPRWAIAYKFETERAESVLQRVTFQVGRTGVITPVANFNPILISGSMVKRATLHNADFMNSLDLREGDTLLIEKGGEIIPKVVGVETTKRYNDAPIVNFATHCPDCGSELIRQEGEVAYYCPNHLFCPTQAKESIFHYSGRKAADINIGRETIEALYKHGFVKSIGDLYKLTENELLQLDGFKERSVKNLLSSIEGSKNRPYAAILFGIGIPFVGEGSAKLLASAFPSITKLSEATMPDLCRIDGIGEVTAKAIRTFFNDENNLELIHSLKNAGVTLESNFITIPKEGVLKGKTIVISGTFTQHSREAYEQIIEQHGGKKGSSISRKTTFVLAGAAMGPSKKEKAESLGIPLINEEEFLSMINKQPE